MLGSGGILGVQASRSEATKPQWPHISCSGRDSLGEEVIKPYTPTLLDSDIGYFELGIKMNPQGRMSQHFREMRVGDFLSVKGPKIFSVVLQIKQLRRRLILGPCTLGIVTWARARRLIASTNLHSGNEASTWFRLDWVLVCIYPRLRSYARLFLQLLYYFTKTEEESMAFSRLLELSRFPQ